LAASSASSGLLVVDATGHIAGRLSSKVAKLLLEGQKVVIVNADAAVLSGRKRMLVQEFHKRLEIGGAVHPKYGPFHPRRPDRILSRMVRGMLPRTKPKGEAAMKRLRVYAGVPIEYGPAQKSTFVDAKATRRLTFYASLGDVAKEIGWKGE